MWTWGFLRMQGMLATMNEHGFAPFEETYVQLWMHSLQKVQVTSLPCCPFLTRAFPERRTLPLRVAL